MLTGRSTDIRGERLYVGSAYAEGVLVRRECLCGGNACSEGVLTGRSTDIRRERLCGRSACSEGVLMRGQRVYREIGYMDN